MSRRYFRPYLALMFMCVFIAWWSATAVAQNFLGDDSELGYKMRIVRDADAELSAQWDRLSPLSKSLSYVKRGIPLYSWIVLCTAVDDGDWEFFMGECLYAQTRAIFRYPRAQYQSEYLRTLDQLWSKNPLDALSFSAAMVGQSTNDQVLSNAAPFLPIAAASWILLYISRALRSNAQNIKRLPSLFAQRYGSRVKTIFWVTTALWLSLSLILRFAALQSPFNATALNLGTINLILFGIPSLVLGILLGGKWIWSVARSEVARLSSERQRAANFPKKRWDALVKYDEEISSAASELRPFGSEWIEKLGEEFFALNEDRRYLPRIVARLAEEARGRR
jgi:hypothetical protein